MSARAAYGRTPSRVWRLNGSARQREAGGFRNIPEEVAVAILYEGATYAVMMATPCDLTDFAIGFSLTEGVVGDAGEIEDIEIVEHDLGMQVRLWLTPARAEAVRGRARRLAGPVGCGLCGVESLAEATRAVPAVAAPLSLAPRLLLDALAALAPNQPMHMATRSTHAAGFWHPQHGLVAVREDVGRHNALDKLIGALAADPVPKGEGAVLLTSRVSVEMVQKTAVAGIPLIVAVSAPTTLAVRIAEQAGITLVAVARADGFEVFTHPERIAFTAHAACA
ncbi:MAG: formate dehydrogenase accessory sulfurtransferase FdhD [Alphaproteobacteria bacterium]